MIITEPSIEEVRTKINKLKGRDTKITEVHAMIESGAKQWVRLLHSVGVQVQVVNPKKARRFKESIFASMAKDDFRDAKALLAMIQSPAHQEKPWKPSTTIQQKLDYLVKMHEKSTKEQTKQKQQFRSYIQTHLPLLKVLITDMDALWVLHFFDKVPSLWAT